MAGLIARPAPQQPPLQYDVSVTLKLVQVYVTDRSGNPVRDLTKEDFALTDNGKRVVFTEFEKHDLTLVTPAAEPAAPEVKHGSAPGDTATLNRKFIILFDFAYNTLKGVAASIKAAGHFLETEARPEDETALLSVSMLKGLKIHEFLTTDHDKVKKALAEVTTKDIAGRADEIEEKYWLSVANPGLGEPGARMGQSSMEMERLESACQAGNYFRALTRLAQALRLVPGEKSVLFFSGGVPYSLVNMSRGAGSQESTSRNAQESTGSIFVVADSVLGPLQEAMLKEFSASNCTFYAFDIRESSKIPALFTFDQMAFMNRASSGMLGADTGGLFRDDKTTGMDSLRRLSRQTGGQYYSNIGLYEKNLEEVSAVTGTYYVLGYSIPTAADGKFHDVKVEVKRKGCRVRTQAGYFNPKPYSAYTDLEKSIHLFDLALNERSELRLAKPLAISALAYDADQGQRVRALTRIPRGVWNELGGKTAELVVLFFDAQDGLLSLQRTVVSPADYQGQDLLFTAGILPHPGLTKCRVVLRDLETGRSAVASAQVHVGTVGAQAISVHSPLLIVQRGGLFQLEGVVKGISESPSWREIYPFDAEAFSPILGGDVIEASNVGVIIPYSASGVLPSDLIIKANLVNSTSGENLAVPFELRESSKRGAVEILRLELSLDGVPSGAYLLYVHIGDKASGAQASAYVPLTLKR